MGGWSTPRPSRYLVPMVQEAGWVPVPVCMVVENLAPPPGFDPQTFKPVASHYTDYAILAPYIYIYVCVCVCVCVCTYIQGVPGGMCQTLGGCFLC